MIIRGGILIHSKNNHGLKKLLCFWIIFLFISSGCMIVPSEKIGEDVNTEQSSIINGSRFMEKEKTEHRKTDDFLEYNHIENKDNMKSLLHSFSSAPLSESVVVKGFIKDNSSHQPIENAHVFILDSKMFSANISDSFYSNETGYYQLCVDNVYSLITARAHGYFSGSDQIYNPEPGRTYWINFSLVYGKPPENSIVNVEVYDNDTNDCIEDALVIQSWKDNYSSMDYNYSYFNQGCTYEFHCAKGNVSFQLYVQGYFSTVSKEFIINENETRTFVFTLNQIPPENCTIHGTVLDNSTNNPIENAFIELSCRNKDYDAFYQNYTYTDHNGEYSMQVTAGTIHLFFSKLGYFDERVYYIELNESETKKIDIVLYPHPDETSVVNGVVTNNDTGEPLENASVTVFWEDSIGHHLSNTTKTDASGNYELNVAKGVIHFRITADSFFTKYSDDYSIGTNEQLTLDFSLDPRPVENAKIVGVVKNNNTNQVISNAEVLLIWESELGYDEYNYTVTDDNGFFMMNVAEGYVSLTIYKDKYYNTYTDDFFIEAYEIKNMELFLIPHPEEHSIVHGYVKEHLTNDPLENVTIRSYWTDNQGHYSNNNTKTDDTGFYTMNVPAGNIYLDIEKEGYFDERTDEFTIEEYESTQVNVTLYPQKNETAMVTGHVLDNATKKPIREAKVSLHWRDNFDHYHYNYTETDENGSFTLHTIPGSIHVRTTADDYFSEETEWFEIGEYEKVSHNFSINPKPEQTALVKGVVRDAHTNKPLIDAGITLHWHDSFNHNNYNYTETDENGSFEMHEAPGEINLRLSKQGYFSDYTKSYIISENEILNLDFYLYSKPEENAFVMGNVQDAETNEPISDASVNVQWSGQNGNSYTKYTKTDENGFYQTSIAAGCIYIRAFADDYYSSNSNQYEISEYENFTIDISLTPKPEENALIQGYILDETTQMPIENAYVKLYWNDSEQHDDFNTTYSDEQGFYSFHVAKGTVELVASKEGYIRNQTHDFLVNEHETISKMIALFKKPEECSWITGFVNFEGTDEPLNRADVTIQWEDEYGHYYTNDTETNQEGYYEISVPPGIIDINIDKQGFLDRYKSDYLVYEDEHVWFNTSLSFQPFDINFYHPVSGIYFNNERLCPLFFRTIIIGDIELKVDASSRASKAEFYINGRFKNTDESQPFTYDWDTTPILLHRYLIKVKVYDDYGNSLVERKMVTRFF